MSVLLVKVQLKATSSPSSFTLRRILHLSLVRRCPSSFSALGQQADVNKAAVGCQSWSTWAFTEPLAHQAHDCSVYNNNMHVGLIIHNDEWVDRKEVKEHEFHQGWHQNCPMVLLRRPCAEERELLYLSHDLFNRSTAESILSSTSFWIGNSTAVQRQNLNKIMRTAGEIICVLLPLLQDIYPELLAQSS